MSTAPSRISYRSTDFGTDASEPKTGGGDGDGTLVDAEGTPVTRLFALVEPDGAAAGGTGAVGVPLEVALGDGVLEVAVGRGAVGAIPPGDVAGVALGAFVLDEPALADEPCEAAAAFEGALDEALNGGSFESPSVSFRRETSAALSGR